MTEQERERQPLSQPAPEQPEPEQEPLPQQPEPEAHHHQGLERTPQPEPPAMPEGTPEPAQPPQTEAEDRPEVAETAPAQAAPPPTGAPEPSAPEPQFPPPAGFWRRFGAWVLDYLLLANTLLFLGLMFRAWSYQIGPRGRPIGLVAVLLYYGLLNSRLAGGQTPGKRLFRIAVRDEHNRPISPLRSLLRTAIWVLPFALNGFASGILVLDWLAAVLALGLFGALVYTMLFNRKARQGIHDLLVRTYVVYLRGTPQTAFPKTWTFHWVVVGLWMVTAVVLVSAVAVAGRLTLKDAVSSRDEALMEAVGQELLQDPRVIHVFVSKGPVYMYVSRPGEFYRRQYMTMRVVVWHRGPISQKDAEALAFEVARRVLEMAEQRNVSFDVLYVHIVYGFDLGVVWWRTRYYFGGPVIEWRRRLRSRSLDAGKPVAGIRLPRGGPAPQAFPNPNLPFQGPAFLVKQGNGFTLFPQGGRHGFLPFP